MQQEGEEIQVCCLTFLSNSAKVEDMQMTTHEAKTIILNKILTLKDGWKLKSMDIATRYVQMYIKHDAVPGLLVQVVLYQDVGGLIHIHHNGFLMVESSDKNALEFFRKLEKRFTQEAEEVQNNHVLQLAQTLQAL